MTDAKNIPASAIIRELRIKTHVQWRHVDGQFVTYSGSVREADALERKGLSTTPMRLWNGQTNDTVLSVTPQQAADWLESRDTKRTR